MKKFYFAVFYADIEKKSRYVAVYDEKLKSAAWCGLTADRIISRTFRARKTIAICEDMAASNWVYGNGSQTPAEKRFFDKHKIF